jgi:hypothetical protein
MPYIIVYGRLAYQACRFVIPLPRQPFINCFYLCSLSDVGLIKRVLLKNRRYPSLLARPTAHLQAAPCPSSRARLLLAR